MHEGLCKCSEFSRLLAIALLNWSDDEGYFMANPILIRGQVFPFEEDSKKVPRALQELSSVGWITLGKDDQGRDVGFVKNFTKHQRVDTAKPSSIKGNFRFLDESGMDQGCFQDESWEEWNGMEVEVELGKGKDLSCPQADDEECLLIWSKTPAMGKQRSSKKQLAQAWKKIKNRPSIETLTQALDAWNDSKKWKEGYCEGIHIWVTNEQWDNLPKPEETGYRSRHPNDTQEQYEIKEL
jgi:hypothetical protein